MKSFQILSASIIVLNVISAVSSQNVLMQFLKPAIPGKPLPEPQTFKISSRVFNGEDVIRIEDFPYQARLHLSNKTGGNFDCSGSIISRDWILTAAHCLQNEFNVETVEIVVGTVHRNTQTPGAVRIRVNKSNFIIHENYNKTMKIHDIALIKLDVPLRFSAKISSIDLVSSTTTKKTYFDKHSAFISGWGSVINSNMTQTKPVNILQHATVNIIDEQTCSEVYPGYITETHICTVGVDNVGACKGDSGGPLAVNYRRSRVLIGVAAFAASDGCGLDSPRGYTRVSSHLGWLCQKAGFCPMIFPDDK